MAIAVEPTVFVGEAIGTGRVLRGLGDYAPPLRTPKLPAPLGASSTQQATRLHGIAHDLSSLPSELALRP